jgi:hypothetical protein
MAFIPTVLRCHVAAFDKAEFRQTLVIADHITSAHFHRLGVDKPDGHAGGLLRRAYEL